MRYIVATIIFGLLGFGGCGDPDTSNWSKEKIIKAIEIGRTPKIKCAALWQVSVSFSHWDLSTQQRNRLFNVLIQALRDEDFNVRVNAAEALESIGPDAKETVAALIQVLKNEDFEIRGNIAKALGSIGPDAKEAVPALIRTLKDEGSWVRESAAEALGRIKPNTKEAVAALTQALEDEDGDVRNSASEALKRINFEAETTEDTNFDF